MKTRASRKVAKFGRRGTTGIENLSKCSVFLNRRTIPPLGPTLDKCSAERTQSECRNSEGSSMTKANLKGDDNISTEERKADSLFKWHEINRVTNSKISDKREQYVDPLASLGPQRKMIAHFRQVKLDAPPKGVVLAKDCRNHSTFYVCPKCSRNATFLFILKSNLSLPEEQQWQCRNCCKFLNSNCLSSRTLERKIFVDQNRLRRALEKYPTADSERLPFQSRRKHAAEAAKVKMLRERIIQNSLPRILAMKRKYLLKLLIGIVSLTDTVGADVSIQMLEEAWDTYRALCGQVMNTRQAPAIPKALKVVQPVILTPETDLMGGEPERHIELAKVIPLAEWLTKKLLKEAKAKKVQQQQQAA
jgi:hypothetical protein